MKLPFLLARIFCAAVLTSCTLQNTPNTNSPKPGVLQGIIGGKTELESRQTSSLEKRRFEAIASRTVMVAFQEITANGRTILSRGTGVIVNESIIATSAHYLEGFKFDNSHGGAIFFGASGRWQDRERQYFSKADILNRSSIEVDQMATKDWSLKAGNKDYILIRLREPLPAGFQQMWLMNDLTFFKIGDPYRAAGFGLTEGKNGEYQYELRTLDLTLSRASTSQSNAKYSPISEKLGVEDHNFFLEFDASAAHSVLPGDSGGPLYYEFIESSGKVNVYLAGLITAHQYFGNPLDCQSRLPSCWAANYGLRIDALRIDVLETAKRINRGDQ